MTIQTRGFTSFEYDAWERSLSYHSTVKAVLRELKYSAEQFSAEGLGWTQRSMNGIATAVGITRRRLNQIIALLHRDGILEVVYSKTAKAFNELNRFCLSGFLAWLPGYRMKDDAGHSARSDQSQSSFKPEGGDEIDFRGGDETDFSHTNSTLPNSTLPNSTLPNSTVQAISDRDWEFPQSGSIKHGPIAQTIRNALPEKEQKTCVDFVMACFREVVAKDDKPVTLSRLIGFCRKFRGPGRGSVPHKAPAPSTAPKRPSVVREKPAQRGDAWDQVVARIYERSPQEWLAWFSKLDVSETGSGFVVVSPSRFHAGYVERKYGNMIEGLTGGRVRYEVAQSC